MFQTTVNFRTTSPTFRRAFRELDGQAIRIGQGEISGWLWRLPIVPTRPAQQYEQQ